MSWAPRRGEIAVEVLLVEDDRRIAATVVKGLSAEGFTVDCCATPRSGTARWW